MATKRRKFLPLLALAPLALMSACSFSIVSGGGQAAYPYGQAYAQPYGGHGPRTTKPNPKASTPKANKPGKPRPADPQSQPNPRPQPNDTTQPGKSRPNDKAQPGKKNPNATTQPGKPRPQAPESNTRPGRSKATRAVVAKPAKSRSVVMRRR